MQYRYLKCTTHHIIWLSLALGMSPFCSSTLLHFADDSPTADKAMINISHAYIYSYCYLPTYTCHYGMPVSRTLRYWHRQTRTVCSRLLRTRGQTFWRADTSHKESIVRPVNLGVGGDPSTSRSCCQENFKGVTVGSSI